MGVLPWGGFATTHATKGGMHLMVTQGMVYKPLVNAGLMIIITHLIAIIFAV